MTATDQTISNKLIINNSSPTLYFKDTNQRSGMIHMNDNRMYFLSGDTNSESWSRVDGQWPLYLQTDTNTAVFGGNIISPRFRSVKPVNNVPGSFSGNSGTIYSLAQNVPTYGGTLIFHVQVSGYATSIGGKTLTIRFRNSSNTVLFTIPLFFYFNQTSVHQEWSITHVQTGIPANTNNNIQIQRSTTTLRSNPDDRINVTIQEMPY